MSRSTRRCSRASPSAYSAGRRPWCSACRKTGSGGRRWISSSRHAKARVLRQPPTSGRRRSTSGTVSRASSSVSRTSSPPPPRTRSPKRRGRRTTHFSFTARRGKERAQEEFFHTFNALFEAHKQIVLTSDRPPKEIPGLEDRLISRFEWGMVADIGHPDLEHRIAILRKKAEQDHLELTIPDDVLRFIAEHIRSSVRELEGCIIKLLLFASLKNREVTIELAREALSDKIRQGEDASSYGAQPTPSIDRVQEVVARRWGVTPEGLRSKARTKTLTIPRQVAMYLARNMLSMQLVEIGQAFGGRDHSTVIHSVDKVERQMMRDRTFKERVEMARQELSAL